MLETSVITEVTTELVLNTDVKSELNITFADDDAILTRFAKSARKAVERYCSISIGAQTRVCTIDLNAYEQTELPYGPVTAVTLAQYRNDFVAYENAIATEDYDVDGVEYKMFTPFSKGRWKVTYTAGYDANSLPADLKNIVIRLASWYYAHRGDEGTIPDTLKTDLLQFRRLQWI